MILRQDERLRLGYLCGRWNKTELDDLFLLRHPKYNLMLGKIKFSYDCVYSNNRPTEYFYEIVGSIKVQPKYFWQSEIKISLEQDGPWWNWIRDNIDKWEEQIEKREKKIQQRKNKELIKAARRLQCR